MTLSEQIEALNLHRDQAANLQTVLSLVAVESHQLGFSFSEQDSLLSLIVDFVQEVRSGPCFR